MLTRMQRMIGWGRAEAVAVHSLGSGARGDVMIADEQLSRLVAPRPRWVPPERFDLTRASDRARVDRYLAEGRISCVRDEAGLMAESLCAVALPSARPGDQARARFVEEILCQGERYGRWVLFPWSGELVHYPDAADLRRLLTARNRNLITEMEQQLLADAVVMVVGMSVGSHVAASLAMTGVGGRLVLVDGDLIEPTNLNRLAADVGDLGVAKVDRVAMRVSAIDPYLELVVHRHPLDDVGLRALVEAHRPQIIFDEVDSLQLKAAIRFEAKRSRVATIAAGDIGDRSIVDVERHDLGNVQPFNGRFRPRDLEHLLAGDYSMASARPMMRLIGLRHVSARLADSYLALGAELSGVPQLGTTALVGGAVAAVAARELILGRRLRSGRYVVAIDRLLRLQSSVDGAFRARVAWRALRRYLRQGDG